MDRRLFFFLPVDGRCGRGVSNSGGAWGSTISVPLLRPASPKDRNAMLPGAPRLVSVFPERTSKIISKSIVDAFDFQ